MHTLLMPDEDWDTVQHLCRDRKVLQIGVCDGQESVMLARVARSVVVTYSEFPRGTDALLEQMGAVLRATTNAHVNNRVILMQQRWTGARDAFTVDQFDVAFITPAGMEPTAPQRYLRWANAMAWDLIVAAPSSDGKYWDAVTQVCPRPGYGVTGTGRLIVARDMSNPDIQVEV